MLVPANILNDGGLTMTGNNKGKLFSTAEEWRVEIKKRAHLLNDKYNAFPESRTEERREILRELLGELNEGVSFNAPIRFHYGAHTKIGKNCFFNFNFTCQDDAEVTIGKNYVIGAGSVVTRSIPENSLAAGNPCRVIRTLSEKDSLVNRPEILGDYSVIE